MFFPTCAILCHHLFRMVCAWCVHLREISGHIPYETTHMDGIFIFFTGVVPNILGGGVGALSSLDLTYYSKIFAWQDTYTVFWGPNRVSKFYICSNKPVNRSKKQSISECWSVFFVWVPSYFYFKSSILNTFKCQLFILLSKKLGRV